MRVSIIVPVINEVAGLPKFLEDIQGFAAEVVFVDGGSTDGTVALLRAAGRRCLESPPSRALQMNTGANAAAGDALLFLHADTRLPRDGLDEVFRALRGDAVGGFFGLRLSSRRPLLRVVGRLITWRSRLTGIGTGDQAIFVTRGAFERLGGYSPLPLFEDVDLCRRLKRIGPLALIDRPVESSARRWERHGAWRTIVRMWTLRLLYYCGADVGLLARHYEAAR